MVTEINAFTLFKKIEFNLLEKKPSSSPLPEKQMVCPYFKKIKSLEHSSIPTLQGTASIF